MDLNIYSMVLIGSLCVVTLIFIIQQMISVRKGTRESKQRMKETKEFMKKIFNKKEINVERKAAELKGDTVHVIKIEELEKNGCWPPHENTFNEKWMIGELIKAGFNVRVGFKTILFIEEKSMMFIGVKNPLSIVKEKK